MDFSNIKNILKDNRLKAFLLALVTLISALLIISSINMLSFNSTGKSQKSASNEEGKGKGGSNKNNPGNNDDRENNDEQQNNDEMENNDGQQNNNKRQNSGQDDENLGENPEEGETGDNRDSNENGMGQGDNDFNFNQPDEPLENGGEEGSDSDGSYTIPGELKKKLKNQRPEFNIDLSKDDSIPRGRYFGDGNTYSVQNVKKANHVPLFEVLGKLDSPFIKMTVQDAYSNSKWHSDPDKTAKVYKYNENNINQEQSCKIKFINPANGFIPVPANLHSIKVPVLGVLTYPDEGVFYSDFMINDSYEVFLKSDIPDRYVLENSNVDRTVIYNTDGLGRLKDDVMNLVEGMEKPYEKIEAIADFLESNFSQGSVKNKADGDALYRFLSDRKGSQLDFVSTFVMLLRCADIPARLVTGYRVDPSASYQIVYADQMCVYPEVSFEGYGWVPLDYFADIKPIDPPKRSVTNITKLNETAVKGNGFNVAGTVKDTAGKVLNGQTVLIYLKKDKYEECLSYDKGTVKNGVFDIDCVLKEDVDVGSYQVIAKTLADSTYKESDSDPELKVLAETDISIAEPEITDNGRKLLIDSSLFERLSKKPVSDGEVKMIYTNSVSDRAEGVISAQGQVQDGRFATSLDFSENIEPEKKYIFFSRYLGVLKGEYIGTDYYIPSAGEVDVNLIVVHWWRIIIALFVCLVISILMVILLKRKRQLAASSYGKGIELFNSKYRGEGQNPQTYEEVLKISFPDIGQEFENVWGINEVLRVRFHDSLGNFDMLDMLFNKKGIKRIKVLPTSGSDTNVSRIIRIVCYSEEVLMLGKKLNDILYDKFGFMPKRLTPREIIKSLQSVQKDNVINGYTDSDIEELILILEKAAYSIDEVRRADYERFYLFVCALQY